MQRIIFVAHCILNTASKVLMDDSEDMKKEAILRREFLTYSIENDIQLVQLPCPEFILYGAKRWGHVSDQFDNGFFREHCKNQLRLPILELNEYISNPTRYEVIGIVGIEGSPSCGVNLTCVGPWGGSKEKGVEWAEIVEQCKMESKPGIFIQELKEMLKEKQITIPIYGLNESDLQIIKQAINSKIITT